MTTKMLNKFVIKLSNSAAWKAKKQALYATSKKLHEDSEEAFAAYCAAMDIAAFALVWQHYPDLDPAVEGFLVADALASGTLIDQSYGKREQFSARELQATRN